MDLTVFLAVLTAAALHASWNAMVKHSGDKFTSVTAVVVGHSPLALVALTFVPSPAPQSWPYILAGMTLHVFYQLFLLFSYRIGDLTQVYPIARGSAPMIVAAVSVAILGVELSSAETVAVLMIGIGIMSLVLTRGADGLHNPKAAMLALTTGCFIAGYSLVDGLGARLAGTAVGFYSWLTIGNTIVFSTIMSIARPGVLRRVAGEGRWIALIGGSASYAAFAIVIWAFTQAPIALVTALRETSIIFALLIGVGFLKERLSLIKVASTALTISGAILLKVSR